MSHYIDMVSILGRQMPSYMFQQLHFPIHLGLVQVQGWEVVTAEDAKMLGNMLAMPPETPAPDMPGIKEGGIPKGLGNKGIEEILILSISDSCSLLVLALLFWNQILTWTIKESFR